MCKPSMPWDVLARRLCASQESSDSHTALAEAIAAEESSDGEIVEEPPAEMWWVSLLKGHTEALGFVPPAHSRPVRLLSACSGCCSEAAVYEDILFVGSARSLRICVVCSL